MGEDKRSSGQTNNFDFLRLLGALLVIVGHSQTIAGQSQTIFLNLSLSSFGVVIFFSLSGYLVMESWLRSRSIPGFLRNRCLRILPGLLVVVALSVLLVGPLVTTLTLAEYFRTESTWTYFANVAFHIRYDLPGVFLSNPFPIAVNGSLWTLPVEVAAYLCLLLLAILASRRLELALLLGIVLLTAANVFTSDQRPARFVWYATDWYEGSAVLIYFAVGAFLRIVSAGVSIPWTLAAFVGAWLSSRHLPTHLSVALTPPLLACAVVGFGRMASPGLRELRRWGDPSYGMYLVGFPASQLVVAASVSAHRAPDVLQVVAVSSVVSILYGYASWHLVERPCLRLKQPARLGARALSSVPATEFDSAHAGAIAPVSAMAEGATPVAAVVTAGDRIVSRPWGGFGPDAAPTALSQRSSEAICFRPNFAGSTAMPDGTPPDGNSPDRLS